MTTASQKLAKASMAILTILMVTMLLALYHGVQPHPPRTFILGGMAPFLGTGVAFFVASWLVGPTDNWAGRLFAIAGLVIAILTFGPQKYIDPAFPVIWHAVIASQIAIVILITQIVRGLRSPSKAES